MSDGAAQSGQSEEKCGWKWQMQGEEQAGSWLLF